MKFNKLSKEYQNELKLLAQNRLIVFAELNELNDDGYNTIMCLGGTNGLELTSSDIRIKDDQKPFLIERLLSSPQVSIGGKKVLNYYTR